MSGHHEEKITDNITIGFFKPEVHDVMDKALAEWKTHKEEINAHNPPKLQIHDDDSYSFAYWLFRYSGLVETTEQAKHLEEENATLRERVTLLEAALRDWLENPSASKSPTFYKELFGGILARKTLQVLEEESGADHD